VDWTFALDGAASMPTNTTGPLASPMASKPGGGGSSPRTPHLGQLAVAAGHAAADQGM
jgi:hypothetical protein